MSCSETCAGACCAVFTIWKDVWDPKRRLSVEDGEYIADMLVAIPATEAAERARRFGSTYEPAASDGRVWFKCRHWDEETRLCTAYDERPRMCSEYPYGQGCDHSCGYELSLVQLATRTERLNGPVPGLTLPA